MIAAGALVRMPLAAAPKSPVHARSPSPSPPLPCVHADKATAVWRHPCAEQQGAANGNHALQERNGVGVLITAWLPSQPRLELRNL